MCNSKAIKISSEALLPILNRKKQTNGATFTIKSYSSGKEYTYKISRKSFNGKWFTFVKVEKQYLRFNHLGSYFNGNLYHKKEVVKTPAATAIAFILGMVEKGKTDWLDSKMGIYHLGKCLCCGKTLTDHESISRGVGPVCANIG